MFVRGHMHMGMCVYAHVRRKYIFVLSSRTEFTGTIPPLVCSVCLNELQVCVRMRMRVAAVIVWFPMRVGPFMGGSRPARRLSEGGRGGGGGLRLVAVAGCGAASRPVGSASAHAASPGSLAGLSLSNVVG